MHLHTWREYYINGVVILEARRLGQVNKIHLRVIKFE